MNLEINNIESKINSNNNDVLKEIVDYLNQIIKYAKDNLIKREKNDEINLEEENQSDDIELSNNKNEIQDKIKLGEKSRRAEFFCEKGDEENGTFEIKNNPRFLLNKKGSKLKEINYHKYINEIIKTIETIIIKINKNIINNNINSQLQISKNKKFDELEINSFNFIIKNIGEFSIDKDQEIKYDDGRYIGQL